MATSARAREDITDMSGSAGYGHILVWLDDTAEDESEVKEVFNSLFDNVFTFTDPEACLDLVHAIDIQTPCLSILISGKYGQTLVRDHLQPLIQVKDIYVFCFDTTKHGRWAQTCDKVRCVFADITKIVQCMQFDMQNVVEQQQRPDKPPLPQTNEIQPQQRERFTDDYNLFDYLALNLLLQSPDDGIEDFTSYCQTHRAKQEFDPLPAIEEGQTDASQLSFNIEQTLQEWYRPDLCFLDVNSNDLTRLWTLRWFIRHFHRQLLTEQDKSFTEQTKFTVYHGTCLSVDELDAMKHRVGQIIIVTELLLTHANRQTALTDVRRDEQNKHRVVFEINVDTTIHATVPYARINSEKILVWFGARYSLRKIEYIDEEDPYWLIGLGLCPALDLKPSLQTLYEYYLKELNALKDTRHAFGRILMHKGSYARAEKWLQSGNHYRELAELAIRQSHYEQANRYLEHLPEECDDANLLRAYLLILTSSNDMSKARLILLRIFSEATDKLIRARANTAFGFISLTVTQQFDEAFEHFTLGNESLRKLLPTIHPAIARSFIGLGYTQYCRRQIDDAKKCFQAAFHIQKQSLIYNHPDLAKTRNGLAHCLSSDQQTLKRALNEAEYALNILVDNFPSEHHPEVVATKSDLDRLRKGKELRLRDTLLDYI